MSKIVLPPNAQKKTASKQTAENDLLKPANPIRLISRLDEPQLNIFYCMPELCLACITSYYTVYAGRCSDPLLITWRNHMIYRLESATHKKGPRAQDV